ncbi:MAG TPA: inositol monophosphatase family protein [Spirochaetia bacterium]|nr:inositol monophosphatase family protein [Spirochaetia bacterium]
MTSHSGLTGLQDGLASRLCRVATEAANAAGRVMRESFGSLQRVDQAVPHDLKLWLDRACEQEILHVLRASFPGHAVLSEEKGFEPGREPYLWVVDPLDGTVNYFHGIPYFCTSIACYAIADEAVINPAHRLPDGRSLGAPILGIVYDPLRDELFTGTAGRGASLNRGPLLTPEVTRLEEALVALSFGAREESILYMSRILPAFTRDARKVRSFGSTALDMVQVAAGRIGAFVQMGTNLWDFAAAAVIIRAAGAVVDAKEYAPGRFRIIASAQGIFEQVRGRAEG